ncbi:hypothetical protein Tco_0632394 [Tanacetum coccineum]
MIDRLFLAALVARDANKNGDDIHTLGTGVRRNKHAARECTYPDFLKCKPLNFKGTEGVVGLTQWFEKMELVLQYYATAHNAMEKLKKMLTDKSLTRGEIRTIKFEHVELKVEGLPMWGNYKPTFPRTGTNVRSDVSRRVGKEDNVDSSLRRGNGERNEGEPSLAIWWESRANYKSDCPEIIESKTMGNKLNRNIDFIDYEHVEWCWKQLNSLLIKLKLRRAYQGSQIRFTYQLENVLKPGGGHESEFEWNSRQGPELMSEEAEVPQDEAEHEESVPTPSNDPQPSGEDSMKLTDLMERIQRLERRKISRPTGLKRLRKVDASKQGRSNEDIDADVDVSLVDETQERQDDELIFDTGVLDDVEMPVEAKVDGKDEQSTKKLDDSTAGKAVTTVGDDSAVPTTNEEITLAQTLIHIKAAKPKVFTTAATTTTTTRPKDKGVVVQEPSEFRVPQEIKPSSSKDKGKGIMIEPEVPLKKKDQIALDEQIARDIQAKLDANLLEEQKLARKQEEEANIALIEEELTDEEKAKLFTELMEKRRKHFATLRAQEKRTRPPTKAQKRTQMSTYLKHMGGYTYKQLKGKSFDEIQKLFDKEMKRVNTFVAMGSEVQENKEKKEEGREETTKGSRKKMLGRKRAVKEQQKESSKKLKVEEEKESEEVEEDDEVELKKLLVIKKDEDIAIDAIPLATKLPVIIDYKLHKEGMLVHYELIRADGSSKRYSSMIRMLQGIDRETLGKALWRVS